MAYGNTELINRIDPFDLRTINKDKLIIDLAENHLFASQDLLKKAEKVMISKGTLRINNLVIRAANIKFMFLFKNIECKNLFIENKVLLNLSRYKIFYLMKLKAINFL